MVSVYTVPSTHVFITNSVISQWSSLPANSSAPSPLCVPAASLQRTREASSCRCVNCVHRAGPGTTGPPAGGGESNTAISVGPHPLWALLSCITCPFSPFSGLVWEQTSPMWPCSNGHGLLSSNWVLLGSCIVNTFTAVNVLMVGLFFPFSHFWSVLLLLVTAGEYCLCGCSNAVFTCSLPLSHTHTHTHTHAHTHTRTHTHARTHTHTHLN